MATTDASNAALDELLTRGVEAIEVAGHLRGRLLAGEKLRVKFGVDPTAPDLHLGHAVVLRKLAQWQKLGHRVILLIGDFTATIGDPSGRNESRPMLSPQQVEENWQSYREQAGAIVDMSKVEIRRNGEWYSRWSLAQLLELYAKFTVSRVLERDDFQKRMAGGGELSMLELAYPMLQGYDSYELHADVEMGGSDQLFNMLMGRKVQKRLGGSVQDVIATPLLEGTDGVRKMGKSYGNYIALREPASDMFGKLMSVPDGLIAKYMELLTELPTEAIADYRRQLAAGENPKAVKEAMAAAVVATVHGAEQATAAAKRFDSVHRQGKVEDAGVDEFRITSTSAASGAMVRDAFNLSSMSEVGRLFSQNAVRFNGETVNDPKRVVSSEDFPAGLTINVGPHRFRRVVWGSPGNESSAG